MQKRSPKQRQLPIIQPSESPDKAEKPKEQSSAPTAKVNSKFSRAKKVTYAQYITELICEKKAVIDGVDLPDKFWIIPDWKKYFKFQITIANKLLKTFRGDAIVNALKDKRTSKTYSLRSPFLFRIIEEYQKKPPTQISFSGSKIQRSYDSQGDFNTPKLKKNPLEGLDD